MKRVLLAFALFCLPPVQAAILRQGTLQLKLGGWSASGASQKQGGRLRMLSSLNSASYSSTLQGGTLSLQSGFDPGVSRPAQINLIRAHAFPVPFRPSQGHTQITFTRLTPQATVKIFTLSGTLVKTLRKQDGMTDAVQWDVRNESGEKLASGLYLYLIESDGSKKQGKLLIIR
ncbi:MAG: T9SS type A sorting domain-containing protein [Elusimicrobia bacterium]|nr:T9SS type A sorting domain-containing protein [Elusimicrobiota bacterium]